MTNGTRTLGAIVLAAGEGTRMRSTTPKVLHLVCGASMLSHVLAALAPLQPDRIAVVVGHGADAVTAETEAAFPDAGLVFVHQAEQRGTGDAAVVGLSAWTDGDDGDVLIVPGDTPLLTSATLERLVETHRWSDAAATVLTTELDDATGYGRVVRDGSGAVMEIVEHRDATQDQLLVREVNTSVYCFKRDALARALQSLTPDNAQGEYYLTDVVEFFRNEDALVDAMITEDAHEVSGVNDRRQLAALEREMRRRINDAWMLAGVAMVDPDRTYVDVSVQLEPDVRLLPGTILEGATTVGAGSVIGPDTRLVNTVVGERCTLTSTVARGTVIGNDVTAGPFAHLRAGTKLADGVHLGSYVETKNADVREGAKIPHLSYVGDAEIGAGANIGAGTITANYDGKNKHRTIVGAHVRTGSNSVLVAPVELGEGAYVGAGTVVTRNVPAWALAKGVPARIDEDWVTRNR